MSLYNITVVKTQKIAYRPYLHQEIIQAYLSIATTLWLHSLVYYIDLVVSMKCYTTFIYVLILNTIISIVINN